MNALFGLGWLLVAFVAAVLVLRWLYELVLARKRPCRWCGGNGCRMCRWQGRVYRSRVAGRIRKGK